MHCDSAKPRTQDLPTHGLQRTGSGDVLDKRAARKALLADLREGRVPGRQAPPSATPVAPPTPQRAAATHLFNKVAASSAHVPKLARKTEAFSAKADTYDRWLAQFPESDRAVAQVLASALNVYKADRIDKSCVELHQKILAAVPAGNSITYSYIHHAKSGALVSYKFRQANLVPEDAFDHAPFTKNRAPGQPRTLVFLDDYVGTGFQFLQALSDIKLKGELPFEQVIYGTLVANPVAKKHLDAARAGDYDTLYEGGLHYIGVEAIARNNTDKFRRANVAGVTLVANEVESTMYDHIAATHGAATADQAAVLLDKHKHSSLRFGNLGRTVFAHNCPNTVPHMFWDSGIRDGERTTPWEVLLERVHDRSIYAFTHGMPDHQVIFRKG